MQKRRQYFIDSSFQSKFIVKFCAIVIVASLAIGAIITILSKDFTTVTIENTRVMVKTASEQMLPIIIVTVIIVNVFAAIAVIFLTLFTSHKIAGPLYRIKKEIDLLKKGNLHPNFRIRKGDQLQDLAGSLLDMSDSLRDKYILLKDRASQLRSILETKGADQSAILDKLNEIDRILNQFEV